MLDHTSFSALDRHAVLSGSDDGFPWYAGAMLAVEASEVVRLEKLSHADEAAERQAVLMVSEKIFAARAAASWLAGATPAAIINRCRAHVAENAKRLSAN